VSVQGAAGAIWRTVAVQVEGDQMRLLPAVSDHLAYVVLAPLMGAEQAVGILTDDR
jgi:hypothetical protein